MSTFRRERMAYCVLTVAAVGRPLRPLGNSVGHILRDGGAKDAASAEHPLVRRVKNCTREMVSFFATL